MAGTAQATLLFNIAFMVVLVSLLTQGTTIALVARRLGVGGVPASFVIDPEGRIASATVGLSTEPGLRLRLWAAKGEETPPR